MKLTALKYLRAGGLVTLCLPLVFLLASEPQNPDGAELVRTAEYGTVPHPPGFPVLSLLNQLVVKLPGDPVFLLSLFSLVLLVAATWYFHRILEELNTSLLYRFIGSAIFLYFPPVTLLGLQPEKYALLYFLFMFFFYQTLRESLFGVCIAYGLLLAHHDSALFALPIFLWVCFRHKKSFGALAQGAAIVVAIPLLAYGSFIFLPTGQEPWPNWVGEINGLRDLWKFVTYRDFGQSTSMTDTCLVERLNLNVLRVLHSNFIEYLSWAYPLFLITGGLSLFQRKKTFFFAVTGFSLVSLLGLSFVKLTLGDYGTGYIDRYASIPALGFLLLIPSGFEACVTWLRNSRKIRSSLSAVLVKVVLISFACLSLGELAADWKIGASFKNGILGIYQREVGRDTRDGSFFFATNDYLIFYGKGHAKDISYPLVSFFYYDWYRESVAPKVAPGIETYYPLARKIEANWNTYDLIQSIVVEGKVVYVSSLDLGRRHLNQLQRKGLVWAIGHAPISESQKKNRALELCEALKALKSSVPEEKSYFQKLLLSEFRIFFQDLQETHRRNNHPEIALGVDEIVLGLTPGAPLDKLRNGCANYISSARNL